MFSLLQEAIAQNKLLEEQCLEIKAAITLQKDIPPQVLLQKPVVLNDALGRIAPFHLEFINSPEALLAVLRVRFQNVGKHRINQLLFELRNSKTQSEIDFTGPWERAFLVRHTS